MAADVELLPLPQWTQYNAHLRISANSLQKRVQDYARANVEQHTAAQAAEIEALRAEVERWKSSYNAAIELKGRAFAESDRLAEALRIAFRHLDVESMKVSHKKDLTAIVAALHPTAAQEDGRD